MKVLFAMGSEQKSKNVADRYYEKYGEILEYDNVFFFKALIDKVKNNKTYDRIIINEDMEQFRASDVEQIDRFIFNYIDKLTDETEDADIIFVCSDRRSKGDTFVTRLFNIGIYNLLIGGDRNINPLCEIIKKPKNKKEAKQYLNIDSVGFGDDGISNDDEVNELQMISILNFYEGIKNKPEKYLETFDKIAEQYSRKQLKIIAYKLPTDVLNVILEADRYKFLMPEEKAVATNKEITHNEKADNKLKRIGGSLFGVFKKANTKPQPQHVATVKIDSPNKNEDANSIEENASASVNLQKELQGKEEALNQEELMKMAKAEAEERERKKREALAIEEAKHQEELAAKARAEIEAKRQAELAERAKAEALARENERKLLNNDTDEIEVEPLVIQTKPDVNNNLKENKAVVKEDIVVDIPKIDASKVNEVSNLEISQKNAEAIELERRIKEEQEKLAIEQKKIREAQEKLEQQKRELKEEQEKVLATKNQLKAMPTEYNSNTQYTSNVNTNMQIAPVDYKKMVVLVGANKAGTTFVTNAIAHQTSSTKTMTSILDMTRDKGMFYLYNRDDKSMRKIASECMQRLSEGEDYYLGTNSQFLKVYTAIPGAITDVRRSYKHKMIIDTVNANCNLTLVDADFTTPIEYFERANEIYIVQDLDVLKIQEVTLFLRELKNRNVDMKKIKIIINQYIKTSFTPKLVLQGLSYYNDPEMSYVDELLPSKISYAIIPYNLNNYAKYIDCLFHGKINYRGFSTDFINAIDEIASMMYPRATGSKTSKRLFG